MRNLKVCGKEYESLLAFYKSKEWKKLRAAVLKLDHYECQQCKAEGRYSKAQTVHHVHHVKDRPDLALTYMHEGKRNLVSLCRECHNLSQEADNFNIQRKLTVFNVRTDTVLFQMEGAFALSTSDRGELEVTVQTGDNEFKRHFISLPDEVAYVMEDVSGADVDKYHYEINFLPEWGFKVTHND